MELVSPKTKLYLSKTALFLEVNFYKQTTKNALHAVLRDCKSHKIAKLYQAGF